MADDDLDRGYKIVTRIDAVDGIADGAIPTDEQVTKETLRLRQIQIARDLGAVVSDKLYCDAVVRQHRVVSIRSGAGNDAILRDILEAQKQINARLDALEAAAKK
ncbi:hypothetical protein ABFX02_14G121200 [Erythranthe guttata]